MDIKYIGMDVHKKAMAIAVMKGEGKLVMESILLVAHAFSESGDEEVIRIISPRKATPQERSIYAQQN